MVRAISFNLINIGDLLGEPPATRLSPRILRFGPTMSDKPNEEPYESPEGPRESYYPLLTRLDEADRQTLKQLIEMQDRNYTGFAPNGGGT